MPLTFEPPADPLTPSGQAQSHVIESDALQRLTKEIERYGRRELVGRSVLIAGHRGVGKTTLVRKAIENARNRPDYQGRPLFVDLHGPDLLAPPDKDAAEGKEEPASTKLAKPDYDLDKTEAKRANAALVKEEATAETDSPSSNAGKKPSPARSDSQQPSGA